MAFLWDDWKNVETEDRLLSCTMLITEPNRFVAEVHDRMPVILKPEQFACAVRRCAVYWFSNPMPRLAWVKHLLRRILAWRQSRRPHR